MHEKTGAPRGGAAQLERGQVLSAHSWKREPHALCLNLSVILKLVLLAISR